MITKAEVDILMSSVASVMKDYVSQAAEAQDARIDTKLAVIDAQMKLIPAGKDGRDGLDGKDADISAVVTEVSGRDRDFVSASIAPLASRIDELDSQVKSIPAGKDGRDGKDAHEFLNDLVETFTKGLEEV